MSGRSLILAVLSGCAARVPVGAPTPDHLVVTEVNLPGGAPTTLEIEDGRIVAVGGDIPAGVTVVSGGGAFVVPAVIDSHVHLDLVVGGAAAHAAAGVVAAVDLACPATTLDLDHAPLVWMGAGPFVGVPGGYPTTSWGGPSYGAACTDPESCRLTVADLVSRGAGLIKTSLGAGPDLDDACLAAVVDEAHVRGLVVAVHALGDADAARARAAGADLLAHTPIEPLSEATLEAWRGGFVLSTLHAFGATDTMVDNVRGLREHGATVLYGTDLGNLQTPGIDGIELSLLEAAGLTDAEVLAVLTEVPASFWGFGDLGALEPGARATFLLVPEDPWQDVHTLTRPDAVWFDGAPNQRSEGARRSDPAL